MEPSRKEKFDALASDLGYGFDGEIKIGGDYTSIIRVDRTVYVSGQVPRVGDKIVCVGRVGADVTLAQAQAASKICVMRALALLERSLGSLDHVAQVARMTVFVNSAESFTQQSEVADGASQALTAVLGDAGRHTRTSVGVAQLPKNAAVEVDLIVVATTDR